jgi:phosphoglycolate phosphatase-like HAD superfamily hydrolase
MQNPAAKPLDRARIRALIFDVDGTLADTDDNMAYKIEGALKPLHGLLKPGQARRFSLRFVHFSEGPMNWILNVADRSGVDSWLAYILDWRAKGDMRVPNKYQVHPQIPGVAPMLEALSARYPMAVVTNRNEVTTRAFLDSHNLTRFFTAILASQSCKHTKPFADPLIAAAKAMNVPVEDCLMIGDTIVDVHAAIAAKAQSLAVLCGFGTEKQLLKAGVQEILPSTSQLADLLISEHSTLD